MNTEVLAYAYSMNIVKDVILKAVNPMFAC